MDWISAALFVAILAVVRAEYTIKCDSGGCTAKGESGEPLLIQGDILVNDASSRVALADLKKIWPNRIVYFVFHESFNLRERLEVASAMSDISSKTCVTFKPRTNNENYLLITKEPTGCYANVGYDPNADGYTRLNLQYPECFTFPAMQHELLHVLGLYHEQSRPDRDQYVDIHWSNIQDGKELNFNKLPENEASVFSLPYDYQSIMHYGNYDFAKDSSMPTITAKINPAMKLGQNDKPTFSDLQNIIKLYSC